MFGLSEQFLGIFKFYFENIRSMNCELYPIKVKKYCKKRPIYGRDLSVQVVLGRIVNGMRLCDAIVFGDGHICTETNVRLEIFKKGAET